MLLPVKLKASCTFSTACLSIYLFIFLKFVSSGISSLSNSPRDLEMTFNNNCSDVVSGRTVCLVSILLDETASLNCSFFLSMALRKIVSRSVLELLLLLGRPQLTSLLHGALSPTNPVIHPCWQAVSGDPGVRLQHINKCASLSFDSPFAMLQFPQKQIANNFVFTPPAMTTEPKAPFSNCG